MSAPLSEFDLGAPLGSGGMGRVWAATHRPSGAAVAIKVLTAEGAQEARFRDALELELRAMALLDHPSIVRLLDFGLVPAGFDSLPQDSPFLVLERIEGGSLTGGARSWVEVRRVLLGILDGLAHAHARGLIHRDLKPGNVLLRDGSAVLADFGLAAVLGDHRVLEQAAGAWPGVGIGGGTPNYIAPEQVRRSLREQGPWTDLYALGCLTYTLITGEPPFASEELSGEIMRAHLETEPPPLESALELPVGLEDWLFRLLQKDPRHRPRTAADARQALMHIDDADGDFKAVSFVRLPSAPTWDFAKAPRPSETRGGTRVPSEPWPAPQPPEDWRGPAVDRREVTGLGLELYLLRPPRLVGRERIRDLLWSELRQVHASQRPRLVLLRGSSGVGKSRLAEWLAERVEELGVATVFRAHHQEIAGPLDGVGPMLDRAFRTSKVSQLVLAEELALDLGVDVDEARVLAEVLRGPLDRLLPLLQTDAARWDQVARVLARDQRPALVVLDDLQWAPVTLDLCEHLLRSGDGTAALMVATVRQEDLVGQPRMAQRLQALIQRDDVLDISVEALDDEAGRRLVDTLLPLEPELATQLHERCAGNPLFQVQLVGDWVRRGLLKPGPGGLRASPEAARSMPAELGTMWRARVDELVTDLGDELERPLELAAALGNEVDESEWVQLVKPERAGALLRVLVDRGLAKAWSVGRWSWAHAMVREAVLDRAGDRLRGLHRACAALLADQPARHAPHLVAAGRFRDGARVYAELANTLRTTGSSAELLHAGYRALAALQAGEVAPDDPLWPMLRVRVGMEQLNRHQLPLVDEQLDLARPHLDRATWRPYRASFYVMEAWLAARRGESEQLQGALDGALAAFESSTHPGSVAATVSYYLRRVGRLDEALALLDQMLPESSLQVADRSLGMVAQARGTLELGLGHLDLARRYLEYGLARGEETGEARTTLACRGALGSLARAKGDYEGAMAHYEATRIAEAQLGVPHTITDANTAVLDVVRGRPIEAAARFEALLDVPGLPAVLEVGAWVGVVLGWLAEGGDGDPPVLLDALFVRLGQVGSEPELTMLANHAALAADGTGHEDLAARLRSYSAGSSSA